MASVVKFFAISVLALAVPARAEWIDADPATLDAALKRAVYGDSVALAPGKYVGPVELRQGISLIGAPGVVIVDADETRPALILKGENTVSDIDVVSLAGGPVGVRVVYGPARLSRVRVRGFREYGVRAGPKEGRFEAGEIANCGDGLSASGGVWKILESTFAQNRDDGVDLFRAPGSVVVNCTFVENGHAALELALSDGVRFLGNRSERNGVTCAARLGPLPAVLQHNRVADRVILSKRGQPVIPDVVAFIACTDTTNAGMDLPLAPVVFQESDKPTASAPATESPAPDRPSRDPGAELMARIDARLPGALDYAGLVMDDLSLREEPGGDSFITPLLAAALEKPLTFGHWLARQARTTGAPSVERYASRLRDLGVDLRAIDPAPLDTAPALLIEQIAARAARIQEHYNQTFRTFGDTRRVELKQDVAQMYGDEEDMSYPLLEGYRVLVKDYWRKRGLMHRLLEVDTAALFDASAELLDLVLRLPHAVRAGLEPAPTFETVAPFGPVKIAGIGNDIHDSVCGVLIDLGGNDVYHVLDGETLTIIIDLDGDDRYNGAVAGGFMRLSAVWDDSGNDVYRSDGLAQGAGLLGAGFLFDAAGDDRYIASRKSQAYGVIGAGWLWDGTGHDRYRVAEYGQAFGGLMGIGMLEDASGDDHYLMSGTGPDDSRDSSHSTSLGQGMGSGVRYHSAGGIGLLFDGAGQDIYEADLFAQGVGYWYGLGALVDAESSNDKYIAHRYVQGTGVHLAAGGLYDAGGNDRYDGYFVAQGCGYDLSLGMLLDGGGADIYNAHDMAQGVGGANGVGLLADADGMDAYLGQPRMRGQGCGIYMQRYREYGSIGALLDFGGEDHYATGVFQNSIRLQGDHGVGVDD